MLLCPMAASEPQIIDTIDTRMMSCCQLASRWPNGVISARNSSAMAATLGAVAMNEVTEVGAPS